MTQQQDTQRHEKSQRQNIEQMRGKQAWENIKEIKNIEGKEKDKKELEKKYRSLARGLNAMIQINGLGQTLGFLKAKSKKEKAEHFYLLNHLTQWMRGHFSADNKIGENYDGLLLWVLDQETSSSDYRRATTECLAFGTWLSRFAEAELEEPATGEGR